MRTLDRMVSQKDPVGRPIRMPWKELNDRVTVRTREIVVVIGAAGGGKSTLAVNLAMGIPQPVLYEAQDTPSSVIARMTAVGRGISTADSLRLLGDASKRDDAARTLRRTRPTLVLNRGAVTVELVKAHIEALTEWLGEAPPVVVIDNLIDMLVPGYHPADTGFYATALPELKQMAIDYDTAVFILHHVTRSGRDKDDKHGLGQGPMRMSDALYSGEREARHVWGVYNDGALNVKVQILKQQDGPADPSGGNEVALRWYPANGKLVSR